MRKTQDTTKRTGAHPFRPACFAAIFLASIASGGTAPLAQPLQIASAQATDPSPSLHDRFPAPQLEFTTDQLRFARAVASDPDLAAFYGGNGLRPIFIGPEGDARRAALVDAVSRAPDHGLPAARYAAAANPSGTPEDELVLATTFTRWVNDMTSGLLDPRKVAPQIKRQAEGMNAGLALDRFARAADPQAAMEALIPNDPFYTALREALAREHVLDVPPGTPAAPQGLWRPGMQNPALADLRARLAALGFDPGDGESDLYDAALQDAVTRFQTEAGLGADGIAGPRTIARLNGEAGDTHRAILIAMERWRWLPEDLGARHIWINLAEYTTRVVRDGTVEFETRSVIGKTDPDMASPEFSDKMQYIVFNPSWNVPRSITVNEYLPRLKSNPNAVGHLDVVDSSGRVIPRNQIDFSRYTAANFPYRMREKPSPGNALGQVKFLFPNQWNIYLHDTPTRHLFNNANRAYSHGCIRLQRPLDLAELLLSDQTDNPAATVQQALAREGEQWTTLKPSIPVHLVYFTTFPDADGHLHRVPDIYGRDNAVWQALVQAGLGEA